MQYALKNNQFPATIRNATNSLRTHVYDNAKELRKKRKEDRKNNDGNDTNRRVSQS